VTFAAVCIAALAECQPFSHYWQVVPDPGAQCRQGYAYLVTLTVCNVFTDLLLVVFPVPIVAQSRLSLGRKTLLVMLFCLHLFTVVVAVYRVPTILREDGYQATRTMWASAEILMATFAANALALGTFVRDTGVKKKRFRYRQPEEEELRTGRRDSKVGGKKVSWNDPDSDVDGDVAGDDRQRRGSPMGSKNGSAGSGEVGEVNKAGEGAIARTESLDSLIPRSRLHTSTPDGGRVIRTTTIEVSVSLATDSGNQNARGVDGMMLRPADGLVTASARGRTRGSAIPIRDLRSLPDPDVGQGGGIG
jgi:hypothetical protein